MKSFVNLTLALVQVALASALAAGTATLSIDASNVLTTFRPLQAFGTNTNFGAPPSDYLNLVSKAQASGHYLVRYPGGSDSDTHHWNGTGSYVGGIWVPNDTIFSAGHRCRNMYNGSTTGNYNNYSRITDGNASTYWLSHADTDFPNAQWVMLQLVPGGAPGAVPVTRLDITWGPTHASSFQVQYWNPGASNQYAPTRDFNNNWQNGPSFTGTPGTQTVSFAAINTKFIRVLLTGSSAGPGGTYTMAELRAYNGATPYGTPGTNAGSQPYTLASSHSAASVPGIAVVNDFEEFMGFVQAIGPGATPVITANFGTGTPQEAAAWVHYANNVRGFNIKYWEIGNELGGEWETGGPLSAKDYARRYIGFYNAMKAADPNITVIGPISPDFTFPSIDWDGRDYVEGFVKRLQADPGGAKDYMAEGISVHMYGPYNNFNDAMLLNSVDEVDTFASDLATRLAGTAAANAPVFLTEYNANSNATSITNRPVNALWVTHWVGKFIRNFGPRAFTNFFALDGASNIAYDANAGAFASFITNPGPYLYDGTPGGWAMRQLGGNWCIPGDNSLNDLVSVTSTDASLVSYAARRPDGVLALLVSNESSSNTYSTTINVAGFVPQGSATTYTFDANSYTWQGATTPYHASPNVPPIQGTKTGVSGSFSHNFGPYSITVFQLRPFQTPTPSPAGTLTTSPTLTPTPSATASPTAAPTACASILVYNGETGGANRNLGNIGEYSSPGTPAPGTTYSETAGAAFSGAGGLQCSYLWDSYYAQMAVNFANFSNANNIDLSSYTHVEFWVRTTVGYMSFLHVVLSTADGNVNSADIAVNNYLPAGVTPQWQKVSIPLSAFTAAPITTVGMVKFNISGPQSGSGTLQFDEVYFRRACFSPTVSPTYAYGSPSPTRTVTPFYSHTVTLSYSPTPSPVCELLLNGGESLAENGTWDGTMATRSIVAAGSAPVGAVTQGGSALRVDVTNGVGWCNSFARLNSFAPAVWNGFTQLKMDVYVDAALLAGSTYNVIHLKADCGACTIYEQDISADAPSLVAGSQTLTFNLNYGAGTIPPGSPLSRLIPVLNRNASPGTGTLYIDNIRLANPCASPTSSFSVTPSYSATGTASRTASPTRTGTSSASPTVSGSATGSPTRTATATASLTPSSSLTASPSASTTQSPSITPTSTVSETAGGPTRTMTLSFTASPTVSPTSTPSDTVTLTASLTVTLSVTGSFSGTPTATPVDTATATGTATALAATPTSSPVLTGTHTSTAVLATGTATSTAVLTATRTLTAVPATATATNTSTVVLTATLSPTALLATTTATAVLTATPSPTALVATATVSPAVSPTAAPGSGTLTILKAQAQPNPNAKALSVKLDGPADLVEIKIYSVAEVLVSQSAYGPCQTGWNRLDLPVGWSQNLANGTYFARIKAQRGAVVSPTVLVKLSVLK